MGDLRTLEGARHVLTVENKINRLFAIGLMNEGTEVRCLRQNSHGYYVPCVAYIVRKTITGRITVDLWTDRSERVTVTSSAILWPTEACLHQHHFGHGFYVCELEKGHSGRHQQAGASWDRQFAHDTKNFAS